MKPASEGVLVDQVIGIVNGDLILESDVDEEKRFEAFEPFSTPGPDFPGIARLSGWWIAR